MCRRLHRLCRLRHLCTLAVALACAILVPGAVSLPAQVVRDRAADRDTVQALIAVLEARIRAAPDDADSHYRLGRLLADRASERATEFQDRMAAERLLERAIELRSDDPRYYAALAIVYAKRGVRLEAARLVSRALELAEKRIAAGDAPARRDLAWIHHLQALTFERRLEDASYLVNAPNLPVSPMDCGGVLFCENFSRPESFSELLYAAGDLSGLVAEVRTQVLAAYRAAVRYDTGYLPAVRGLLGLLHDDEAWEEYVEVARQAVEAAPDSAWAHLLLATGLWRAGTREEAERAAAHGLARLPDAEREIFEDPERLLRPSEIERLEGLSQEQRLALEEMYWRKADPLLLTPENERRLEHLTRMVYAELRFAAPEAGLRGWDTDRGAIYARFGPPQRIFQVRRESDQETSLFQIQDAISLMAGGPGTLGEGGHRPFMGGRWIFWNYRRDLPSFIFEKPLGLRLARHKIETESAEFARVAIERAPVVDAGPLPILPLVAQVARFRGPTSADVELVILPAEPEQLLARAGEREPKTGLFLHVAANYRNVATARHEGPPRGFYSVTVTPGVRYEARLEVLLPDSGPAARWVDAIDAEPFAAGKLALSDLLVARSVEPRTREPAARRDFTIDPNPRLAVEPGEPLALYFEVYGLEAGPDSLVGYQATLQILDAEDRPLAARLLRSLGRAVGAGPQERGDIRLRWERISSPRGDRLPEYLSVDPGELPPGRYRIRLEVSDRSGGESAAAERTFEVKSADPEH